MLYTIIYLYLLLEKYGQSVHIVKMDRLLWDGKSTLASTMHEFFKCAKKVKFAYNIEREEDYQSQQNLSVLKRNRGRV
jgi:hypothetical protein